MKKRMTALLLALAAVFCLTGPAAAEENTEPIPIHTPEDLLGIREYPDRDYILMADLDMGGIAWKSLDFSGTLDGNGHTILNLTITDPGDTLSQVCDGNKVFYDAACFGLFGTARGAQVKNLTLLNVRAVIDWDTPVFLGAIAGYARDCRIENCTVIGNLELRAHDRMFGVGGLVGYGSGRIDKCTLNVTLINTDTDSGSKDEQFLGGVYAAGFISVYNCNVTLQGYISDYGYVHSGGIVGMFTEYPLGEGQKGYIKGNQVNGGITFFEANDKRRAYCDAFVGEALVARWYLDGNKQSFTRDEKFTYDQELRPEMCIDPLYALEVVDPDCDAFGYTVHTCHGCGYTYRNYYTLPAHRVENWTLVKAPTEQEEGLSTGICNCGLEQSRVEPVLEPVVTTQPEEEASRETAPSVPAEPQRKATPDRTMLILLAVDAGLLLAALMLIRSLRKRKHR